MTTHTLDFLVGKTVISSKRIGSANYLILEEGGTTYEVVVRPNAKGDIVVKLMRPEYAMYFTDKRGEPSIIITPLYRFELEKYIKKLWKDIDEYWLNISIIRVLGFNDRFYNTYNKVVICRRVI